MYSYRSIEVSDKGLFEKYLEANAFRSCDYSFTNIYTWRDRYQTEIAQDKGFLWARYKEPDGRISYMMPLSDGSIRNDLNAVLRDLMAEAVLGNYPFVMQGITREMYEQIEALMPGIFVYTPLRNDFDYLYYTQDLIQLSGKKYQSKRNHIHKLQNCPDCYYRNLQLGDIPACLEMTKRWIRQNCYCNEEFIQQTGLQNENTISEELQAIECAFSHWEELQLKGGVLFMDNKLIAYTYGQPISSDTFGVHIEKADGDVEGAYPFINQCFAQQAASAYTYINREEDMGLSGLRKTKLSYHPVEMVEKGELVLKSQWNNKEYPSEIMQANTEMQAEIRSLWQTCFHDERSFLDHYFKDYYRSEQTLVVKSNDCIIASLQMLPCHFNDSSAKETTLVYLSGLCTLPEHRGCGHMVDLLHAAFRFMEERGLPHSLLITQEKGLVDYYRRFGYEWLYSFGYHDVAKSQNFPLEIRDLESLFKSLAIEFADASKECFCMFR